MPMELRNATKIPQRTLHYLFRKVDFVRCYKHDIMVSSNDNEELQQHLEELQAAKLQVNWDKCQIG